MRLVFCGALLGATSALADVAPPVVSSPALGIGVAILIVVVIGGGLFAWRRAKGRKPKE